MAISRLLLIAAAAGGALLLLGGRKSSPGMVIAYPVDLGGAPDNGVVPLQSDNGFRSAPASFDGSGATDAFRSEAFVGHSLTKTRTVTHELPLADVKASANGTLDVRLFATMQNAENRCASWAWRLTIEDGRVVSGLQGLVQSEAPPCPEGSEVLIGPLPGSAPAAWAASHKAILQLPQPTLSQRGDQVWLTWKTRAIVGEHYHDMDRPDATGFYLDALWRFTPA
jgi:hypothetical protein